MFVEDTYWKPDVVDQQEVLVKVMDTYGKVEKASAHRKYLSILLG